MAALIRATVLPQQLDELTLFLYQYAVNGKIAPIVSKRAVDKLATMPLDVVKLCYRIGSVDPKWLINAARRNVRADIVQFIKTEYLATEGRRIPDPCIPDTGDYCNAYDAFINGDTMSVDAIMEEDPCKIWPFIIDSIDFGNVDALRFARKYGAIAHDLRQKTTSHELEKYIVGCVAGFSLAMELDEISDIVDVLDKDELEYIMTTGAAWHCNIRSILYLHKRGIKIPKLTNWSHAATFTFNDVDEFNKYYREKHDISRIDVRTPVKELDRLLNAGYWIQDIYNFAWHRINHYVDESDHVFRRRLILREYGIIDGDNIADITFSVDTTADGTTAATTAPVYDTTDANEFITWYLERGWPMNQEIAFFVLLYLPNSDIATQAAEFLRRDAEYQTGEITADVFDKYFRPCTKEATHSRFDFSTELLEKRLNYGVVELSACMKYGTYKRAARLLVLRNHCKGNNALTAFAATLREPNMQSLIVRA